MNQSGDNDCIPHPPGGALQHLEYMECQSSDLFTDRGGHIRREKWVRDGIYTDGEKMYRASYGYVHVWNGTKPLPHTKDNNACKAEGELELMEYLKANTNALGVKRSGTSWRN